MTDSHQTESPRPSRMIDFGSAIILSLATMGSAWCAYQATLWSGAQSFHLAAVSRSGVIATEKALAAMQWRTFDASMLIEYVAARLEGSEELEQFLYQRFRPEMRTAVDAWLTTDPFENPDAPPNPFQPQWYRLHQEQEVLRQQEYGQRMFAAAQHMNSTSDTYVLLTVLFASTLFFGGLTGTYKTSRVRLVLGALALVLFLVVTSFLTTLPICKDCDVVESGPVEMSRTSKNGS